MAKEFIFKGKLVASKTDLMGYITYVFETLDQDNPDLKYIMCTQFPNWNQSLIEIGDEGFATVRYVEAGKDTWFDGEFFQLYRYTDVHFISFVPIPTESSEDLTFNLGLDPD